MYLGHEAFELRKYAEARSHLRRSIGAARRLLGDEGPGDARVLCDSDRRPGNGVERSGTSMRELPRPHRPPDVWPTELHKWIESQRTLLSVGRSENALGDCNICVSPKIGERAKPAILGRWAARWLELMMLCVAVAFVARGLHMPPPVGRVTEVVGTVRVLAIGGRSDLLFSIGKTQFSIKPSEANLEVIRGAIHDGSVVRLVTWPGASWPSTQYPKILAGYARTSHGDELIFESRGPRWADWDVSRAFSFIGLGLAWATLSWLRTRPPMASVRRQQELAMPIPAPASRGRERLAGCGQVAGGILLVLGPIALAAKDAVANWMAIPIALAPFIGCDSIIVGAHRALFGRPLTVHDTLPRRVGFGVAVVVVMIAAGLVWWGFLVYMSWKGSSLANAGGPNG